MLQITVTSSRKQNMIKVTVALRHFSFKIPQRGLHGEYNLIEVISS